MCVEHPAQDDVHEEALGFVLLLRQVTVLKVRSDDAPVMRPVPGPCDRVIGEGHLVVNCPR